MLENFIAKYRQVHRLAKEHKERAVEKFNQNQKPVKFFTGDLVIVWKAPRQSRSAEVDISKKFAFRGHGPYRVITVPDKDTYTVRHLFSHEEEKTKASKMTIYRPLQRPLPEAIEPQKECNSPSNGHRLAIPNLLNVVNSTNTEADHISVRLLSENARIPLRATPESAGLDLYTPSSGSILPSARKLVPLDIQIALPLNTYARIAPRSGLSMRGMDVAAGVVDSDYRGNVGVILVNNGTSEFNFTSGDKIAQLVLEQIKILPCRRGLNLTRTQRGSSGFGSSGI